MNAENKSTEQFCDAMRQHRLVPPENIIADGKIHRFASEGKRGDDAGWYVYYNGDIPAGAFGCWRSGVNETWRANIGRRFTPQEETAHKKRLKAMRRAQEQEQQALHAEGQKKVHAILSAAKPATGDHPYEVRKKINACAGIMRGAWPQRHKDNCLLIPVYDGIGEGLGTAWNVQAIFPEKDATLERDKDFLCGARKAGLYFPIGLFPDDANAVFDCYVLEG